MERTPLEIFSVSLQIATLILYVVLATLLIGICVHTFTHRHVEIFPFYLSLAALILVVLLLFFGGFALYQSI